MDFPQLDTFEKRRDYLLRSKGLDPAKYDINTNTMEIVERVPTTPAAAAQKPAAQGDGGGFWDKLTTPSQNPGFFETIARSAVGAIPETVGAMAMAPIGASGGMVLGGMTGPAAPVMVPVGGLVGGAGAAAGGSALAGKLEQALAPEWWKRGTDVSGSEHNIAREIGNAVPQLFASNPLAAGRTIASLLRATPTLTRYTAAQLGQLGNIAAGTGVGAGSAVVEDAMSPEGVGAGTVPKALIRGAAGLLGSEPNKWGTMLSLGRFKQSELTPDNWAGAADIAKDAMTRTPRPQQAEKISPEEAAAFASAKDVTPTSETSAEATLALPERTQKRPATQLGSTTDEWDALIKDVGERTYKQDVDTGIPEVFDGADEVAGKIDLPDDLQRGLVELSKKAGVDTGPHELLHGVINDVLRRGTPGEKRFMQSVLDSVPGVFSKEKLVDAKGRPITAEEALVQDAGQEFVNRLVAEARGKNPSILRDLASFIKARFGRANEKDLAAFAANTLRRGAGAEVYRPKAPGERATPVTAASSKEGEKSPKKSNAKAQPLNDQPVPESPETIAKQYELTADPESTKAVTLLPPGSPEVTVPPGLEVVDVPQGRAVFNPAKVSREEVVRAGSGKQFDGRLLGMSSETKPPAGDNVVTASKDGVKDVVTEVVPSGGEARAVESVRRAVPDGDVEIKPAAEVVGERIQNNELASESNVPRSGAETAPGETTTTRAADDLDVDGDVRAAASGDNDVRDDLRPVGDSGSRAQPLGPRETYGRAEDIKRPKDPLMGPVRRLEKTTDPRHRALGDAFRRLFSRRDVLRGGYSSILRDIQKVRPEVAREAYEGFVRRVDTGAHPKLKSREAQALYERMDAKYREMGEDQIAAGQLINGRERGLDPFGAFTVPSRETTHILTTQQGSKLFKDLRGDFVEYNRSRGFSEEEANAAFETYVTGLPKQQTASGAVDFGAVSLPEGTKLPPSWIEPDAATAFQKYITRFANARAWFDVIGNDPEISGLLRGGESLERDPDVVQAFNSFRGVGAQGKFERALGSPIRAIYSTVLGPVTRLMDLGTTPFKALAYAPVGDIPEIFGELASPGKHYNAAHETGLLSATGHTLTKEVLNQTEEVTKWLDKYSRGMATVQGLEALETAARTTAQALGTGLARAYKARAAAGEARYTRVLDQLGSDWAKISDEELGTRFARLFQGHYDARGAATEMSQGALSPFLSLSRWGAEQYNNFRQFAIEPARDGDYVPLVKFLTANLLGGTALVAARELLTGKKPYIAEIEEIKNSPDKDRATAEAAYKIGNLIQVTGMVGLPFDIAMGLGKATTGRLTGDVNAPAVSIAYDWTKRTVKMLQAIMSGVPAEDVLRQYARDIASRNVQVTQILTRGSDETADANKRRDLFMYKRLSGQETPEPLGRIDYSRADERAFDAEKDMTRAAERGRGLYERAQRRFMPDDPLGFLQEIRTLRSSRIPWMPMNPARREAYLDFIRRTQGEEKALELERQFQDERVRAAEKKGMVTSGAEY